MLDSFTPFTPDSRRRLFVRIVVILGLVPIAVGAGLLPFVALRLNEPMVMLAAVGASLSIVGAFTWRRLGRFEYGLLALPLAAGLLNFISLPTGSESRLVLSLVLAIALLGLWCLEWLVARPRPTLVPLPINRPILAFVAITTVSLVWSNLLRDPLVPGGGSFLVVQTAALVVNAGLPLLALLAANKLREVRWLEALTWITVGLGVVAVTAELFNLPTARLIYNGSRGLFPMWVTALAYSQALFNARLSRPVRAMLLVVVGLYFVYYLGRRPDWISGWLPMLIACGLITGLRSRRLMLVLGLFLLIYFAANWQTYYQRVVVANVDDGGLQRLDLWQRNLELVARHPVFGVGPAGYAVYYMAYNPANARSTHNNYFDVVAQAGILGLGVFLWLFIRLLRLGHWTSAALRSRHTFTAGFAAATLAGCVGAMAGMMLGDWVLPFAYNQTISGFDNAAFTWLFLGGMVSLYAIVRNHRDGPQLGAPAGVEAADARLPSPDPRPA